MATFRSNDDLYKVCPYNPDHKIAPRRYDIHLIKCARNSSLKLEMCPYYSSHRVPKELLAAHMVECPHATPDIVSMVQREKTEWEKLEDEKKQVSEVVELAGRIGGMNLEPKQEAKEPTKTLDTTWDYECTAPHFVIPGLDGKGKPNPAFGENRFYLQAMTKSERRAYNQKLVEITKEKQAKRQAKDEEEKAKAMKEKMEQQKKEEQERLEKEREEREKRKNQIEAKKRAAKKKIKDAKRAAFLAKQAASEQNPRESDDD